MSTSGQKTAKIAAPREDSMHAICPYFATFPPDFVRAAILEHTEKGDVVVDPFSGRGTTLLEARLLGRRPVVNDISPVAFTISNSKTSKLALDDCLMEIISLRKQYLKADPKPLLRDAKALPPFFKHAFHSEALKQVLWLRNKLSKKRTALANFVRAMCLGHLHGEFQKTKPAYFSNNLPHTYCTKPDYSIRFWKKHGMVAPNIDVFDILIDRCVLRLLGSKQSKATYEGVCFKGDVRNFAAKFKKLKGHGKAKLVVTSPPYINVTSYEEDQWLRLWFVGGESRPTRGSISKDDKHVSVAKYVAFMAKFLATARKVVREDGIMVCRIGKLASDKHDLNQIMQDSIKKAGGTFKIEKSTYSPFKKNRQAVMFGGKDYKKSGEYDFVLKPI